ncbi:hypothetical protein LDENG_00126200 [Lucifuga dentata]|nr:hypothetical protein LDENG_00126200 [Lucifuga dentata]
MKVLPIFLYLFQCLPIFLTKSFFKSTNKLLSSFIWAGKNPRLRTELLERERQKGRLAIPNLMNYYWAANLQKIVNWFQSPDSDWCLTETKFCTSSSLAALITTKLPFSPSQFTSSPVVSSALKIWIQFRQAFNLTDFSIQRPICNNHLFPAAKLAHIFRQWQKQGLVKFSDFYINSTFANYNDLAKKFNLSRHNLFRYFQAWHFIQAQSSEFPQQPVKSGVDAILETALHLKGQISSIYNTIMSLHNVTTENINMEWAEELGIDISSDSWNRALSKLNEISSHARLKLIQLKTLHRTCYSKVKLAKNYSNTNKIYEHCQIADADLSHMFWICCTLGKFWQSGIQFRHSAQS